MMKRRGKTHEARSRILLSCLLLLASCLQCRFSTAGSPSVHGEVRWTGNLRRVPQMARIGHYPPCPSGAYQSVRHRGRQLSDVAVWLMPIRNVDISYEEVPARFTVDESRCEFVPRLAFASPGAPLEVMNHDPQRHWLLIEGETIRRRQLFHRGHDPVTRLLLRGPDRIRLWSGLHRWMEAWILVVGTPWRGFTDERGRFALEGVPVGEYVLHAWHPLLGEFTEIVSVPLRKSLTVEFARTAPQADPALHLSIPRLRDEWIRPRGDSMYR